MARLFNSLVCLFVLLLCFVTIITLAQAQPYDGCAPGSFQCGNGICVSTNQHCDGNDDCGDGSDEADCSNGPCVDSYFQCQNGNCIPSTMLCDSENDCGDNTDEGVAQNCPDNPSVVNRKCSAAHFQCANQQCIPVRFKCDNKWDCEDKSDEDTVLCTAHLNKLSKSSANHLTAMVFFAIFSVFILVAV